MKPIYIKKLLISEINKVASEPHNYCTNPDTDFTRNRKLSMGKMLQGIIGMESKSLTNELLDLFDASAETPSASAFIQQRDKIRPIAFESIFKNFSKKLMNSFDNDIPVFAIDGSDIQIPTNPTDTESYIAGTNGHKGYNLLHINALYDLNKHIYSDVIIQKARERNEHKAFQELVDCSEITKALIIADRGYESFNSMAHIQEKGWFFLIRVRDGNNGIKQGLDLPESDCFDVNISLKLTRKKTNAVKELLKDKNHYRMVSSTQPFDFLPLKNKKAEPTRFYELNFRIVRFPISEDIYETVVTNLDEDRYPAIEIKKLYASRWGIETSFRDLKYTVGLLNFHSKKVMCILQEIYAHMIMYNFAEMITSHVAIEKKQRKYTYKANFSVATHICRLFYREKTTPPDLEAIIAKNLIPIRPDRHRERNVKAKIFQGFLYRVA
ncbi:IS4 family transposase [Coprococcus sp. LG100-32]|uniref:IS4 family transposase n=1 Tax=Coprococcus sp. LG100-32 TaxID=2997994 RepID=UPI0022E25F43|nr:IS4 family transposase [Coprococcus sp. LG100-32]